MGRRMQLKWPGQSTLVPWRCLDYPELVMRDSTRPRRDVEEPDLPPNLFVMGLLRDLREGEYSRAAWGAFWKAAWVRSLQILQEHPERFPEPGIVVHDQDNRANRA